MRGSIMKRAWYLLRCRPRSSVEGELGLDHGGEHLSSAVDVVVADHVSEAVRLLELPLRQVDPLPDLACGLGRPLSEPALELGHVGADEDRNAPRDLLLHGERSFE